MISLILLSTIAGMIGLLIIQWKYAFSINVALYFLLAIVFSIIFLSIIIFVKINQLEKEAVLSSKMSTGLRKSKFLVLKGFSFYLHVVRSPFIQISMVTALSSFVYLSLMATTERTNLTLLGEFINIQISEWQYMLVIGSYFLAGVTLIESIISLLTLRNKEIKTFLDIGWKVKHIYKLYFFETMIWIGLAILVGSLISAGLFAVVFTMGEISLFGIFLSSILFYLSLIVVSSPFG